MRVGSRVEAGECSHRRCGGARREAFAAGCGRCRAGRAEGRAGVSWSRYLDGCDAGLIQFGLNANASGRGLIELLAVEAGRPVGGSEFEGEGGAEVRSPVEVAIVCGDDVACGVEPLDVYIFAVLAGFAFELDAELSGGGEFCGIDFDPLGGSGLSGRECVGGDLLGLVAGVKCFEVKGLAAGEGNDALPLLLIDGHDA